MPSTCGFFPSLSSTTCPKTHCVLRRMTCDHYNCSTAYSHDRAERFWFFLVFHYCEERSIKSVRSEKLWFLIIQILTWKDVLWDAWERFVSSFLLYRAKRNVFKLLNWLLGNILDLQLKSFVWKSIHHQKKMINPLPVRYFTVLLELYRIHSLFQGHLSRLDDAKGAQNKAYYWRTGLVLTVPPWCSKQIYKGKAIRWKVSPDPAANRGWTSAGMNPGPLWNSRQVLPHFSCCSFLWLRLGKAIQMGSQMPPGYCY